MPRNVETAIDVRPVYVEVPQEELDDLRRRIASARWRMVRVRSRDPRSSQRSRLRYPR
jgi:hypothetical protein